jgi:serine/threonine protein kinase
MGLSYATPVDIWSCGCIFAELFLRKPLFPGQYEMDQLTKIFDVIGLPSEQDWPERAAVTRNNFRAGPPKDWSQVVPEMDANARDLISVRTATPSTYWLINVCLIEVHIYFTYIPP